jgi:polysaccharide biosynthesis/export protein
MVSVRVSRSDFSGILSMTNSICLLRRLLAATLVGGWLIAVAGCQPIDFYDRSLELPVGTDLARASQFAAVGGQGQALEAMPEPPRELAKMSLPAYRIEPPDVIQVELLKLVPKPPYRVDTYDILQVVVVGTLLDQPIAGSYLVEAEGSVNLGPAYGRVQVSGLTIEESAQAIEAHLTKTLKYPDVSVQLIQAANVPDVNGVYIVGPDGTVNLRSYGRVHVAGKTLDEAKLAIEQILSESLASPVVWVDIASYNSKVYYVITEGAGMGDNVVSLPITGNETVLDAVGQIQGLSQLSSKNIWIARPAPGGFGCEQHLPVDWDGITRGAVTATNYQVLPGDRIFIAEDGMVAANSFIDKLTSPLEQLLGITSLGTSTIRSLQTMGRNFNRNQNRF